MMDDRFTRLPAYLAERTRAHRLGRAGVPALLAHPDWTKPAPFVLWMHGRTANKELDPGRYLRWLRAGIAACAVDLPGHGERMEEGMDSASRTLDVLERVLPEIDQVVDALAAAEFKGVFDLERIGIGGMSAGGMAALRRLCDPHGFRCAAVESTTGDLMRLYFESGPNETGRRPIPRWPVRHDPERVARLDPAQHLATWRPIPLLVLHNERDRVVPIDAARAFADALRQRYGAAGADPGLVEFVAFPESGAPDEHAGFGRYSNDAKNRQTEFYARHLT